MLDAERLSRLLASGFDGVLHFAALSLVGESVEQPGRCYRTNVAGTLNLLEGMRLAGIPRLVFSSTAAVYGNRRRCLSPRPRRSVLPMIGFHAAALGLRATSFATSTWPERADFWARITTRRRTSSRSS